MTIELWISPNDLKNSTSELAPQAARLASRVLYGLTGRVYGGEKTVVETYLPAVAPANAIETITAARYGIGIGAICRIAPFRLATTGELRIPLRRRPVREVIAVTVTETGEIVDPGAYTVNSSTYLTLAPSVPGLSALTVEYVHGTNPPPEGAEAARILADEIVALYSGGNNCRLNNVTSFTRQGVAYEIEDARTILTDGRTGIPEVDLFVASVNPTRAKMRSRVISPDSHFVR